VIESSHSVCYGKTGLMSALVDGRYDLVPILDPKLGPRKVDVASMCNTERYRPSYSNKCGLPIFLNPVVGGATWKATSASGTERTSHRATLDVRR
jgi:hypothetical protein